MNELPTTRQVEALQAVRKLQPTSAAAVAGRLGVAPVTAWKMLCSCERKGLAYREGTSRWRVTEAGERWAK